MRKLILFLIVGMILVNFGYLVLAEECQVARPYYGSVNCKEIGTYSQDIWLSDGQSWTCEVPTCEITGMNMLDFTCSGIGTTSRLKITKSSGDTRLCSSTWGKLNTECSTAGVYDLKLTKGDTISVDFSCNLGGNPEGNPKLGVRYKIIALQMHYDSGENFQSGTEFCQVDTIWDKYKGKQLNDDRLLESNSISSSIDFSSSNGLSSIPNDKSILEPKQLEVGQGYWFVYEWVTRPNLNVKDFNGAKVWCNPIDHSLTKFSEVNTQGNNCYLIPTEKLSQTVECCSSDECKLKYSDQEIFCTDDFKCGYQKSCLSDYDCSGVSSNCESKNGKYYLVSSSCDKGKLDSYGKGKCINDKREVKCCSGNDGGPNNCGSGSFCDYEDGCKDVTYKSSQGEIKTGVQGEKIGSQKTSGITGAVIDGGSSTGMIILVIFLILIGGSIGFYFYRKNKKSLPKTDTTNKETKKCSKCGNKVYGNFCTKCGKKI